MNNRKLPAISLVIPAYKVEEFIERCLLSCIRQEGVEQGTYEIIVVDDGSPDHSGEIAESVLADFRPARVFRQDNRGLGGARNTGAGLAEGEYIWFIDSDDWIAPDSIRVLLDSIERFNHPDVVLFRSADVVEGIIRVRQSETECHEIRPGLDFFKAGEFLACAPFHLIKKSVLKKNKLEFDSRIFYEDTEFLPRLAFHADAAVRINDVLYYVYQNPDSITRAVNFKKPFDLLKVCQSLSSFLSRHIYDKASERRMHRVIAIILNNALDDLRNADKSILKLFCAELQNHKYIFRHLSLSGVPKYIIERILFSIYGNYMKVYRVLCFFKRVK